ncbi:MAG: vitamin B12/bleomycin/antimicrobial peptide transport system ATP-binding/permease protein [Bradyrhizobium sp.]
MSKVAAKSRSQGKRSSGKASSSAKRGKTKPAGKDVEKPAADDTSEFVDVIAEDGDHVEPPPPEVVEPDPEMSPEEAEQARKDYLLTRF